MTASIKFSRNPNLIFVAGIRNRNRTCHVAGARSQTLLAGIPCCLFQALGGRNSVRGGQGPGPAARGPRPGAQGSGPGPGPSARNRNQRGEWSKKKSEKKFLSLVPL